MDDALTNLRRAHGLNPHNMYALNALGFGESIAGNPEKAIEHLQQALRLSPRDPGQFQTYNLLAMASVCAGQYANGVQYALLGIGEAPGEPVIHAVLAANYVGSGEIAKAKAAMEAARGIAPAYVQRMLAGGSVFRRPDDLRRTTTFFRIAAGVEDPRAADALR